MTVFASILEGLALLKTSKDSNIERVQSCIAQAAKFQFDPTVKIMQLEMLTLLLDFASSLYHQSPDATAQKLRLLQQRLDECEEWNNVKADFQIPVKKQPSNARTVSEETSTIIRPGGEGEGEFDFVVMSFMTKVELRSLVYVSQIQKTTVHLLTWVLDSPLAGWLICINHQRKAGGPLSFGWKV